MDVSGNFRGHLRDTLLKNLYTTFKRCQELNAEIIIVQDYLDMLNAAMEAEATKMDERGEIEFASMLAVVNSLLLNQQLELYLVAAVSVVFSVGSFMAWILSSTTPSLSPS